MKTLRSSYGVLLSELKKIEDTPSKREAGSPEASLDKILSHLAGQLGHFLTARSKMMDLYPFIDPVCHGAFSFFLVLKDAKIFGSVQWKKKKREQPVKPNQEKTQAVNLKLHEIYPQYKQVMNRWPLWAA